MAKFFFVSVSAISLPFNQFYEIKMQQLITSAVFYIEGADGEGDPFIPNSALVVVLFCSIH